MVKHRIRSTKETDDDTGLPLYWSNSLGWVDRESAMLFTSVHIPQKAKLTLDSDWEAETVTGCSLCGAYGRIIVHPDGWHPGDLKPEPDATFECEYCGRSLTFEQLIPPTITPDNQFDDAMSTLRLGVVALHRALYSAGPDELEDVPRAVIGTHLQVIEQSLEALTELAGEYQLTR